MKVKVLIPFHFAAEKKDCVVGDELEVTYEQYMAIKHININMVEAVEEEKSEKPKNPKPKTKQK